MTNTFWKNKKVLVTGGTGFIGSHLVELLLKHESRVRVLDRMTDGKIKNISHLKDKVEFLRGDCADLQSARAACAGMEVVMNLAAKVGGIEYNIAHQADMFRDNMMISSTMIEAARLADVERYLVVSSACVYPHDAQIPTPESEGVRGEPEPTNSGYGWAKRYAELEGLLYAKQYGMKVGIVRPYNAYGPRDDFDPTTSHVIPALIRRVLSGENPVCVWGSGKQTRAFLYVEDFAEGLLHVIEKYPEAVPVNLGTDEEISLKDLVNMIIRISGNNIVPKFDTSKPDGSPRRNSDNSLAKSKIQFVAKTSLEDGIAKTLEWYRKNLM